ncbi:amidohydrolase family protein [Chitinophaga defluvii]|uniref:Amidohydrolase family protein n=1 Tax=Chitinophaga defluvii TaxID=3163343 RepID=A0ABV2TD81_9BACT
MSAVIDAHQHFWHYNPVRDAWITDDMKVIQRNFLPEDLAPVLAANQVDGCVAVQADQSEEETFFLLKAAEEHDFVKGVVGWVDLRAANIAARLSHFAAEKKLKGFRHIVQAEPDNMFLLREDFCNGVKALAVHDFTYDILVYPTQLPAVEKFVEKFPEQRLVIDHMAKPYFKTGDIKDWAASMRKIAQSPHVHCKVSGMVTEADWQQWQPADFKPFLDVVLEAFGPERMMFGSDWPVCLVAGDYGRVKALLTDYISALTDAEQHGIMGENAVNFYKL